MFTASPGKHAAARERSRCAQVTIHVPTIASDKLPDRQQTAPNDKTKQNGPIHLLHESSSNSHVRTICAKFMLRSPAILSPPRVFRTKRHRGICLWHNDLRHFAQNALGQNSKNLERHDPFVQFAKWVGNRMAPSSRSKSAAATLHLFASQLLVVLQFHATPIAAATAISTLSWPR
jgi:hypothetical protein